VRASVVAVVWVNERNGIALFPDELVAMFVLFAG
jgi:hypothetical protein